MQILVCGEALIDLLPDSDAAIVDPARQSSTRWQAVCGGGPMNTSIALARLGNDVEFLGGLGDDPFAAQLQRWIDANGVSTEHARRQPGSTALAVASVGADGSASYAFHLNDTATFKWNADRLPVFDEDSWLHVGSLACVIEPSATALREWVRASDVPFSFDVNVRSSVITNREEYWDRISPWLDLVRESEGILRASSDDIAWLTGEDSADFDAVEAAREMAAEWQPGLLVVTLGSDGAAAIKADGRAVIRPGIPVDVVDTVGAGDTFTAGFLTAWLDDPLDLDVALDYGIYAAAITCSRAGAVPPTADEVAALVARGAD